VIGSNLRDHRGELNPPWNVPLARLVPI